MFAPLISFFKNLPSGEKKITMPTWCTLMRFFLTPFVVIALRQQRWGWAFFLFLAAAFTDVLDGLLARWYNEHTFLGAFLDPLADKIFILSCFFTLALENSPSFVIAPWFVAVIFFKELIVLLGSLFIIYRNGSLQIEPTLLGKYAMFAQVAFIAWLFICYFCGFYPFKTYQVVVILLILLVIAALFDYVRLGLRWLRKNE